MNPYKLAAIICAIFTLTFVILATHSICGGYDCEAPTIDVNSILMIWGAIVCWVAGRFCWMKGRKEQV